MLVRFAEKRFSVAGVGGRVVGADTRGEGRVLEVSVAVALRGVGTSIGRQGVSGVVSGREHCGMSGGELTDRPENGARAVASSKSGER